MVLPASHKISRVSWYSGAQPVDYPFRLQGYHLVLPSFPAIFDYEFSNPLLCPQPQINLVWALSRSLAATKKIDFSFSSSGYLDVSVPLVFLQYAYFIQRTILEGCSSGFPHSEIFGLTSICDSPKHIGAYPVLHRLLVPRHSPYALNNLTFFS